MKSRTSSSTRAWLKDFMTTDPATLPAFDGTEQEKAEALNTMGVLHASVERPGFDVQRAEKCFRHAAEQGHPEAQINLALLYLHGVGVSANQDEAKKWLLRAAEKGNASGQYHLGVQLHRESFSTPDASECQIESLKWLLLAAGQKYLNADMAAEMLTLKMTAPQLAESNARVSDFQKKLQG